MIQALMKTIFWHNYEFYLSGKYIKLSAIQNKITVELNKKYNEIYKPACSQNIKIWIKSDGQNNSSEVAFPSPIFLY